MTRPRWSLALVATLMAFVGAAIAGPTYRWVDEQGVVHYSDTPQPGAEKVPLPAAQTYHPAPTPPASTAAVPSSTPAPYQSCAIVQPLPDQSLFAPESLQISVQLMPELHLGDALTVTLDGASVAPVAPGALQFRAGDIDRGSHTLNAVVRDATGRMLCSASPVTFYVQRPSLLAPGSPAKGH